MKILFALLVMNGVICSALFGSSSHIRNQQRYAAILFQRLAGTPIQTDDPVYRRLNFLIGKGDLQGAADLATNHSSFYNITLRNLAAPWSSRELSPAEGFNDLQALVIGITRDQLDARLLLTGDLRYEGYRSLRLPAISLENNDHYKQFEIRGFDAKRDLTRVDTQWDEIPEAAGIFTTRAWAKAHYDAGTNRRSFDFAMSQFMCAPLTQIRDASVSDLFVRRDVDRNIGKNPATYQNHCRLCHGIMDGLGGAFAKLDFVDSKLVYYQQGVAPKYNQNPQVYPAGYSPRTDHWENFATENQNAALGWRGPLEGRGIAEFGKMLANSQAFSRCMTKQIFQAVCRRDPYVYEKPMIQQLADEFEQDGYKLRNLFGSVATRPECIPQTLLTKEGDQ